MAHNHRFEFLGPYLGPTGIIVGLPLLCYALAFLVSSTNPVDIKQQWQDASFLSWFGCMTVFGYAALITFMHVVLPAKRMEGILLENQNRLTYRLNGLTILLIVYGVVFYGAFVQEGLNLSLVHDHWLACLTASVMLSGGLSVYLFCASFGKNAMLSKGGQTGYHWYDFFIGRELNPRLGLLDLKEFCELYPGLIGWTLLNLSNCHKQLQSFGHITNSMLLVNAFQWIYVLDALYYEPSILTTMDITNDGFGFMLAFGDLTWVPFIYALQSKYLAHNPTVSDNAFPFTPYICFQELSTLHVMLIVSLNVIGYCIFRGANGQKDRFRRDPRHPSVVRLKTLKTKRGRELLVDGWWGMARHINYTGDTFIADPPECASGDWLLGLSWCLPCGFASPIPYFYAVYFGILLIHRDLRDEEACRQKYGTDWDKYCAMVPYRFVPYVY